MKKTIKNKTSSKKVADASKILARDIKHLVKKSKTLKNTLVDAEKKLKENYPKYKVEIKRDYKKALKEYKILSAKAKVRKAELEKFIKKHPFVSVALAVGAGIMLNKILGRRKK